MPAVYFPSREEAEVVEVDFLMLAGGSRRLKLLVDSGFTGQSSFILGDHTDDLIWAVLDPTTTTGALHGQRDRAWVKCRIPEIGFQKTLIAILADVSPLSLPNDIRGMVGLSFLRQFSRWGGEQSSDGWRFVLAIGND
jgi:hypothetical protein